MTDEQLWAELEKFGCNVPTLKQIIKTHKELEDMVNGIRTLKERFSA